MMVTPIMAQTEFMKHIDECHWLTNEQKEIFKQLPPLSQYAEGLIKDHAAKIQAEKDINLEQVKSQATSFYSKYLKHLPPEFLKIATSVIQNGEYKYDTNVWTDSCMLVIFHGIEIPDKIDEEDMNDYLTNRLDDLLSGVSLDEQIRSKLEPMRKHYMNKDKIAENFGIKVAYSNESELLITIIHETGHVLDYAYRILNDIYEANVKGINQESVSLFFELLAKKEYGQKLFAQNRLIDLYREMIQHDYLMRIRKSDYSLRSTIIDQVHEDWKSPLDTILNYVDFSYNETYDETKEALEKINKKEQPFDPADQIHIHNTGRAFDIISTTNTKPDNIPSIFYYLTKKTTQQISAETFKNYLKS